MKSKVKGRSTSVNEAAKERLEIDFLYLDLSVCRRCQGTDSSLEEAISELAKVLETTGVQVVLRKIHIKSEEEALRLGFLVSPTIRVNGRDIQMNFRESPCDSCSTLCVCEGTVSCREWEFQGQWYTVPPKGLMIEAILKEVYGGTEEKREMSHRFGCLPDNLQRYFTSVGKEKAGR